MTGPMRLVIFDVDGTLVDSQHHIQSAMEAAFAQAGMPAPTREETLAIVGLSLPVAMRRLAPLADDDLLDLVVNNYRTAFGTIRNTVRSPLFPGALDALDRLGRQPATFLGVATGKSRRGLDHLLATHDLRRRFATVQVADDHPSKPHPSMLWSALRETGVEARHAVMVGDTTFDMEMARNAGICGIGVAWGYHPPESLLQAGAALMIESFAELSDAVEALGEAA